MSDAIIHAKVIDATQAEVRDVEEALENGLEGRLDADIVVSTDRMELHELPALDEYVDELAVRIAEELDDE